jgi:PEGA domain
VALDRLRGARTTITLSGDTVDYAALPRGKLQLRANPYADVSIGKESLGTTPFPPVDVVTGTYTIRFRYSGREEVRTVEVAAGETVRAAVDFGG